MKKFKKYALLTLLIAVGVFICTNGYTYAKYVSNSIWEYYLGSKGFYFNSDNLGSSAIQNVDNLWNGESVHFNIRNNLNTNTITDYDIGYNVVCTVIGDASTHSECHMNGTTSNIADGVLASSHICVNNTTDNVDVSLFNQTDCESGNYDWVTQVSIKDLYFDVVLTDYNYKLSDVTVNIAVTSTSPYRKVLIGDFILHKENREENKLTMNYNNYSNYDKLIVSNSYASAKCVRIAWNADNLLINADNSAFSSYGVDANGYINEIKFNIGAKDSLNYIFYKKNFDITYDVSEFLIEEASGC